MRTGVSSQASTDDCVGFCHLMLLRATTQNATGFRINVETHVMGPLLLA